MNPHFFSATFRDEHRYTIPTDGLHGALFVGIFLLCWIGKALARFRYRLCLRWLCWHPDCKQAKNRPAAASNGKPEQ
ncbi:hypothetical protein DL89DRAFT_185350 [Linderina pennispora]|uniref:Uncharacterized protein n=1 Tax=Linderina pennispora TaxID=61395 RepID=A0A1Y1VTH2_9FUNG|nr:uncharacterized protein DL89DRAFT_185350 [Linderina pennispora]ORX64483.1 hypothetical protein DL89DRAFT_185350 [Linderina pennispora]